MKTDPPERNKRASPDPSTSPGVRWDTNADVIQRIQRHVAAGSPGRTRPRSAEDTVDLWQKMAMDRIAIMLTDLTSNTSAVIEQFNRNPKSFDMDAFIEYLDDSADHAVRLADQIANFADFGKSNGRVTDRTETPAGRMGQRKREKQ